MTAGSRRRIDLRLTACVIPAMAVLLGLGVWQVERLDWKEKLIAERAVRLAASPVQAETAANGDEGRRVLLRGWYLHDRELPVLNRTFRGTAGLGLLTPMRLEAGGGILVDRGWVPRDRTQVSRPKGLVETVGVLRRGGRPNRWVPDNDPGSGQWFFVDVARMAAHASLADARPLYAVLLPDGDDGYPAAAYASRELPNKHLEYALTWFSLALVLAVVYAVYHLRRRDLVRVSGT